MTTKLKMLGKEYTIESDTSEDYMQNVAKYVTSKCETLKDATTNIVDTVLLAALDIADELFQERELRATGKNKIKATIALLEHKLGSL
jgi:cell division protein ZapA (FtsZ GTPase activity inhibitor)